MTQREFNILDDEKLIWACVEPIVLQVRGKDPETKLQIIRWLKRGQQALFMYQILYGHASHSVSSFIYQISYLAERLDIWSALKSGMDYFHDSEMRSLIEKMESAYNAIMKQNTDTASLNELDEMYRERLPATLKLVGTFIRGNPGEFMQFED